MARVSGGAVAAAGAAGFLVGPIWYGPLLFGGAYGALLGPEAGAAARAGPSPGEMIAEFLRVLLVALVLARLLADLGIDRRPRALALGLRVWLGFQATLLLGAVLHEGMPPALYAIHAGDALAKTLVMAAILGGWPRPPAGK